MIRLPGGVLTGGRAVAIEAAGAASQITADFNPEVYDEGSRPAWTPGPASSALPDRWPCIRI